MAIYAAGTGKETSNNGSLLPRLGVDLGFSTRNPLIPDNMKDELEMVKHFKEEFKNRYCETHMPAFKIDLLKNILENARSCPVREKKPVAVYLHHDNSSLSDLFCSEGLCSADVVTYLNRNFVIWGWDMSSPKIKSRIRRPLSSCVRYSFAERVEQLRHEQLPLLLTFTGIQGKQCLSMEVISYIRGASNGSDILNCLMQTKQVFDDNHAIELQKLEEHECRESAWSIPWKHALQDEASKSRKKKEHDQTNLTADMSKMAKELAQVVVDGNLDKLRDIQDQGGKLSVCVMTPFHENLTMCLLALAAWEGHTHLVDALLGAGLSVEGSGTTNWTPLMMASKKGHKKIVEMLLSYGAKPLARDGEGAVALHHAAFCGQMQCVTALIPKTPTTITDDEGRTPIHAASLRGHKHVIERLKASGWKLDTVDKEGNTALHMSVWFGSLEVVEYLMEGKLNPYKKNNVGITPLEYAVLEGHHNIERWFMKRRGGSLMKLQHTQQLVKSKEEREISDNEEFRKLVKYQNVAGVAGFAHVSDVHLMDERGMTILHWAVKDANHISPTIVAILHDLVHPHVMTYDGLTPLDLACRELKHNEGTRMYSLYEEAVRIMEKHQCPKEEGSPEELYTKMLTVISRGDEVKEVSHLLCAGAPLELVGDFPNSALQQAITNDRSKIVNLLLASQASLIPCTQGSNLLQHAWYSSNTTSGVYCAITRAFSWQLKRERDRLPRYTKGLREDLTELIKAVDGNAPWDACWKIENLEKEKLRDKTAVDEGNQWKACWQKGSTAKKRKFEERTADKLTSFMVVAARANCPLIASFLQRAGAWSYFSAAGTTPLHAALKAGNLTLVETMLRNLGASLYIPDSEHRLPKDIIKKMNVAKLKKLEEEVYKREQLHLEALERHTKDEREQKKVRMLLAIQEALFTKYSGNTDTNPPAVGKLSSIDQETGAYALLVAARSDLQQLLHLLLDMEHLPADLVVDVTSGTTALHEAAAHGKSGCVALLLHALEKAGVANAHNIAVAKAYTGPGHSVLWRLNRYSPLQPDKYGQTALHLAAMFGHKHTFELLSHCVGQDPPCRAGTTAQQIHSNFAGYLRRYVRYNKTRKEITPLDHHDPDTLLSKLLSGVDLDRLPKDAKRANVDMDSGEARQVKEAVLQAVGVILGHVVIANDTYQGRLRLVGSAQDGSKLFAPDEFDINIVIPAADQVSISMHQETDESVMHKGHTLKIIVETDNPHLQGNCLMGDLFEVVKEALTDFVLGDDRLSVVPPSLTRTQVGVAMALAWQGEEYPLLLVGVDLVPVLEVPWHESIVKPDILTPPDTHYMHISNTADGSWRCSFALLEAEVLRQLSPEERCIQLSCKMLLSYLKVERWMPREIKSFCTWWSGRSFNVPVPTGFCLKSSFFRHLEDKHSTGRKWLERDTIWWMVSVFESMCLVEDKSKALSPGKVFAYFGGDCEGPKFGHGAPIITKYLRKRNLKRNYNMHSFMLCLMDWMDSLLKLVYFPNLR